MTGRRPAGRTWWIVGLAIAVFVVVVLAPLASPDPDGLDRVAEDTGFIGAARDVLVGVLPDYTVPGIESPVVSTIVAGLIGVAIVFGVAVLLGRLLSRRKA
jgi:hypothetical protein